MSLSGSPPLTDDDVRREIEKLHRSLEAHVSDSTKIGWQRSLESNERLLTAFRVRAKWTSDMFATAEAYRKQTFFGAYLPARRDKSYRKPSGALPSRPDRSQMMKPAASEWVAYLSYLHVQARLAKEDDPKAAEDIDRWLHRLEKAVADLFELPGLRFEFDRKTYDVSLATNGGPTAQFSNLADGHSSIFQILAEILLRNDDENIVTSVETLGNAAGIVMIDELETHLHPALQEKVFPFLVTMFPNVQFIVTTHSSAVISSIDNAVVYDFSTKEAVDSESLRGIPYGDLMKCHFGIASDIDLESTKALRRLSELYRQKQRSTEEESELKRLSNRLVRTSAPLALEVWNVLEESRIAEEISPYKRAPSTPSKSE
jgi:hypothetical protein